MPGVAMHIVQRGNNRADCFRTDSDRLVFMSMLRDQAPAYACAVHAYCLMTNHLHLLLTPAAHTGPSLMMRELTRCYASYFNRRHARVGTLWQGPYRSCLVDSAPYVLGCHRYVEMNPVRAGLAETPHDFPWSSHRANAGSTRDPLLSPHPEYAAISTSEYARFFQADDSNFLNGIRKATARGYPLVGAAVRAKLEAEGVRIEAAKSGPAPQPGSGSRTLAAREPDNRITYLVRN